MSLRFQKLLVVIKQTAFEEYKQLKNRGQAPKALRWKRLESRFESHKECVNKLFEVLNRHNIQYTWINRVELDRQHLANVDLVVAVGGDGTVLSAAHFLDHGTIPLLGINSDPITEDEKTTVKKNVDERRSHGALCMFSSRNLDEGMAKVLYGGGRLESRSRIQCTVKSTFSETRLVPALNDLLVANPSPAAVSRFRMGWLVPADIPEPDPLLDGSPAPQNGSSGHSQLPWTKYGTVTRFNGIPYDIQNSLNVWSSGMWVCTTTGSSAAMAAAGGMPMTGDDSGELQYLIREHMIEKTSSGKLAKAMDNKILPAGEQLHLRWNSQKGRIFIDGSHLTHDLELGDEILINSNAPKLNLFVQEGRH